MEPGLSRNVVKRARLLEAVHAEAGVRYEDTRLAKQAVRASRRLAWLLAAGAAGFVVEGIVSGEGAWVFGALLVALTAWGITRRRLGAVLAAAFVAVVAVAFSIYALTTGSRDAISMLTRVVALVWGVAMLPDVLTLIRDAELQYAFGLWARREA